MISPKIPARYALMALLRLLFNVGLAEKHNAPGKFTLVEFLSERRSVFGVIRVRVF
jgi:hypothetical protein